VNDIYRQMSHLVLLQHHEIKVFDPLVGIIPHTFLELDVVDHVSHVFVDKSISERISVNGTHWNSSNTHFGISTSALSPKPFNSVFTISIFAYSFF